MKIRFHAILVAASVFTLVFACVAGAQETTLGIADGATAEPQDDTGQQHLVFAEGEQTVRAQAEAELSGPLAGTSVDTVSTDADPEVEVITIPGPTCTAEEGASFVLQDEDGTQADFIDNDNVEITEDSDGLEVTSFTGGSGDDIVPLNERGGDDVLDTGGLQVVTSTGIECEDNPDPGPDPDPDPTPDPEPQDDEKGPLAGGTAIGNDVLVPGDVIRTLPDGRKVVGIDQIVIETENCELTAEGDELTITLSDRGVPFRLRDGDNVDITLKEDGTLVANGRETLGDSFPQDQRDNPTRVIIPIPVDPENDEFPTAPNDTFPIISSTGIEGEGCRVVGQSEDPGDDNGGNNNGGNNNGGNNNGGNNNGGNNNGNNNRHHHNRHHDRNRHHNNRFHHNRFHNNRFFGHGAANQQYERIVEDRVIKETIPNKGRLANTGGVPLTGAAVLALASVGLGVSVLRSAVRRER